MHRKKKASDVTRKKKGGGGGEKRFLSFSIKKTTTKNYGYTTERSNGTLKQRSQAIRRQSRRPSKRSSACRHLSPSPQARYHCPGEERAPSQRERRLPEADGSAPVTRARPPLPQREGGSFSKSRASKRTVLHEQTLSEQEGQERGSGGDDDGNDAPAFKIFNVIRHVRTANRRGLYRDRLSSCRT